MKYTTVIDIWLAVMLVVFIAIFLIGHYLVEP